LLIITCKEDVEHGSDGVLLAVLTVEGGSRLGPLNLGQELVQEAALIVRQGLLELADHVVPDGAHVVHHVGDAQPPARVQDRLVVQLQEAQNGRGRAKPENMLSYN